MRWLHTQWPAGKVEKLPDVQPDGRTNVAGLYVVGDLTGIPLLKFSADTGARAVQTITADSSFKKGKDQSSEGLHDLVIIGGGVGGMAAALEAKKQGLDFVILEASEPFSTIVNFPKRKPIYTYPTDMTPAGDLQVSAEIKEDLVEELRAQTIENGIKPVHARAERVKKKGNEFEITVADGEPIRARRVIVGIGRSGNFRKLGVPGEELDKVYNRLHDPKDYCGQDILVVGGGDSALETAIAIAQCGANVTVSYRKPEFSRPKPENIENLAMLSADPMADVAVEEPSSERVTTAAGGFMNEHHKAGSITLMMSSNVKEIREDEVVVTDENKEDKTLPNDAVFSMIGREAPLEFFRKSGVHIRGEWRASTWIGFIAFLSFVTIFYHWHKEMWLTGIKPHAVANFVASMGGLFSDAVQREGNLLHQILSAMNGPGFYYSLGYCVCVVIFGIRRIKRRKTPYVTYQTIVLALIQCIPLFLLPYILLPWAGQHGWWESGFGGWLGDQFWPNGEYWRAFGLILAWPLFVYNFFTEQPLWGWLILGSIQTFVIIPLIIWRWGKGAYCGWICTCGALAETLGDAHRHKMPHGPIWNRMNMVGQVILGVAFIMMIFRIVGWIFPQSVFGQWFSAMLNNGYGVSYKYVVDVWLAGVLGLGLYFHFSGRVWCRFACPLAALMHIYTRFSRFRIFSEKKKCISCNVCTSVCHQGIDIMNFANKGVPMKDPECVRCSACVQMCPTGVLSFGRLTIEGKEIHDTLGASPVRMKESPAQGNP
jgi:thioredoxin reductase/ferredoxin